MNLTIRKRYQCPSCYSLWQSEEVAGRCCPPDEVFLCGKRIRKSYGMVPCVHYGRVEAHTCQRTDKRTKASKGVSL
jgi:hypothetical protein